MLDSLLQLCQFANRPENRHRQPLPGGEAPYVIYKNRSDLIVFLSQRLSDNTVSTGWEFYISLQNASEMAAAWSLIYPLLFNTRSGFLGIATIDLTLFNETDMTTPFEHGKAIMLNTYATQTGELLRNPSDIFRTLRQIEYLLKRNNIQVGPPSRASQHISDSTYFSFRQVYKPDRTLLRTDEALEYINSSNPFNRPNPYHNLTLTPSIPGFFYHRKRVDKSESTDDDDDDQLLDSAAIL